MVSKEIFLKANNALPHHKDGIQLNCNKQRIQFLVFPEGIYVDKETKDYRTPKINSAFLYFARLKGVLEENKSGKTESDLNFPASVVWQGLVSSFKTDMDIFGQWLDLYYLGEAYEV